MTFAPNTGYAFAVGADTWHSADRIGPEVATRDSILLTYFVDAGALRFLRNRGKRVGNFILSEVRNRLPYRALGDVSVVMAVCQLFAEHAVRWRGSLPLIRP